jgi:DNA-binding transcriptional MerR regulator
MSDCINQNGTMYYEESYLVLANKNTRTIRAHEAQLAEALKAILCMGNRGPQPRKLNEAMTWRQNDEMALEMARAALSSTDALAWLESDRIAQRKDGARAGAVWALKFMRGEYSTHNRDKPWSWIDGMIAAIERGEVEVPDVQG